MQSHWFFYSSPLEQKCKIGEGTGTLSTSHCGYKLIFYYRFVSILSCLVLNYSRKWHFSWQSITHKTDLFGSFCFCSLPSSLYCSWWKTILNSLFAFLDIFILRIPVDKRYITFCYCFLLLFKAHLQIILPLPPLYPVKVCLCYKEYANKCDCYICFLWKSQLWSVYCTFLRSSHLVYSGPRWASKQFIL